MRTLYSVLPMLGAILMVFAAVLLLPLLLSWLANDGALSAYLLAPVLAFACGATFWFALRRRHVEPQPRDGFLLVSLVWAVVPVFAALPLWTYFRQVGNPISFTNAYFEAVSGLTTTGATVLTGLDQLPLSINLWRCFLQWLGGMGILVLMVAILPVLGVGGSQLFKAETAGPMKDAKLTPRIADTAKGLWTVYSVLSILCVLAYRLGGMGWSDAWAHMFATMSLGGLSPHDASFGHFQSPALEWICVIFMLIASCNFALYFVAIRHGTLGRLWSDPELRGTVVVLVGASAVVALYIHAHGVFDSLEESIRMAFFNTVSIGSTTGFATTDYSRWPMFAPILMILLSALATSAGSTGAGIKMIRLLILIKHVRAELIRVLHPNAVLPLSFGGRVVPEGVIQSILAFMLLYGAAITAASFALTASGLNIVTAFSAVMACINNMGPGLNELGPAGNFASLSDFQTWICSFTMILGRLEVMSLLVLFTPQFWRR